MKIPFPGYPEASLKDVWIHDGEYRHREGHRDSIHGTAQLHVTEYPLLQKDVAGVT